MKIAAVSYISFFDNEMRIRIVEIKDSATWKDAVKSALKDGLIEDRDAYEEHGKWIMSLSENLSDARSDMIDGEMDICVAFYEHGNQ